MVEALRRGNHMDLGQLSNVSKMTGGTGISDHEREADNIMARSVGTAGTDWAKRRYDSSTDTRRSNSIAIEDHKHRLTMKRELLKHRRTERAKREANKKP